MGIANKLGRIFDMDGSIWRIDRIFVCRKTIHMFIQDGRNVVMVLEKGDFVQEFRRFRGLAPGSDNIRRFRFRHISISCHKMEEDTKNKVDETWVCYILRNTHPKYCNITYNGSTNDMIRRLRQHNEEIVGGAKATHGKGQSWEVYALLTGFPDHVNALSCEWRIRNPTGKPHSKPAHYRGVGGRIRGLNEVLRTERWTQQCTVANCNIPLRLYIAEDAAPHLDRANIPANIEVVVLPHLDHLSKKVVRP